MSKNKPDLHLRYRNYLSQFKLGKDFTIDESTWTPQPKLKQLALSNGYRLAEIRVAFEKLELDPDVALVWHRDNRCVMVCLYPMTKAQKAAVIADREWFDSLPG